MQKTKKGFTLIELLVVIAIIGILSAIGLVSLNGAREKARDAKRQSDLASIKSAMALYYDDNQSAYFAAGTPIEVDNNAGTTAFSTAMTPYLPNLPQLPKSTDTGTNSAYWYVATTSHFGMATLLEGGTKDWYVLNDQGYGGTFVSAAARLIAHGSLTCTNTTAVAGKFEVCTATPGT